MKNKKHTSRMAFTLLELIAAVLVMSIISVVLLPVLTTASESYTTTRSIRTSTEQVAFALDRMARIVRQAPIGTDDTGVGISTATVSSIEFIDNTGFAFNNGAIEMLVPGASSAKLCPNVDGLSIQYLAEDGITSTLTTPTTTHRVCITITTGELRMSVIVHPRIWIGQGET